MKEKKRKREKEREKREAEREKSPRGVETLNCLARKDYVCLDDINRRHREGKMAMCFFPLYDSLFCFSFFKIYFYYYFFYFLEQLIPQRFVISLSDRIIRKKTKDNDYNNRREERQRMTSGTVKYR